MINPDYNPAMAIAIVVVSVMVSCLVGFIVLCETRHPGKKPEAVLAILVAALLKAVVGKAIIYAEMFGVDVEGQKFCNMMLCRRILGGVWELWAVRPADGVVSYVWVRTARPTDIGCSVAGAVYDRPAVVENWDAK